MAMRAFFEIRDGFRRRYLLQSGNVEFRPVGLALDFPEEHVDGAARSRKLGDFVVADTAREIALLFGASDLIPTGEFEPQPCGGFQRFLHADGGIGGGDGVNARSPAAGKPGFSGCMAVTTGTPASCAARHTAAQASP